MCANEPRKEPIRVVVTGAAGQIAYSLLYMIARGEVFGVDQPLILHLLDIPHMAGVLDGVVMELADCALPLLRQVIPTVDLSVAFKDVSAAFLVGAMPRREGMERKDLLSANVKIFKAQGQALDKHANKDCKVLVVGNPANTNAFICAHYAPSIPRANFSAMTRLDQNRAMSMIATQAEVSISDVRNVIIWGNHSSTQFPDASHALVQIDGKSVNVADAVKNPDFLGREFIETVQGRGAAVIAARKMSSAMSAAKAACDHMHDWWHGTSTSRYVSMAVSSDGSYGIAKDLIYSFPVFINNAREWSIVPNLKIKDCAQSMMQATEKELISERDEALAICNAE